MSNVILWLHKARETLARAPEDYNEAIALRRKVQTTMQGTKLTYFSTSADS